MCTGKGWPRSHRWIRKCLLSVSLNVYWSWSRLKSMAPASCSQLSGQTTILFLLLFNGLKGDLWASLFIKQNYNVWCNTDVICGSTESRFWVPRAWAIDAVSLDSVILKKVRWLGKVAFVSFFLSVPFTHDSTIFLVYYFLAIAQQQELFGVFHSLSKKSRVSFSVMSNSLDRVYMKATSSSQR